MLRRTPVWRITQKGQCVAPEKQQLLVPKHAGDVLLQPAKLGVRLVQHEHQDAPLLLERREHQDRVGGLGLLLPAGSK